MEVAPDALVDVGRQAAFAGVAEDEKGLELCYLALWHSDGMRSCPVFPELKQVDAADRGGKLVLLTADDAEHLLDPISGFGDILFLLAGCEWVLAKQRQARDLARGRSAKPGIVRHFGIILDQQAIRTINESGTVTRGVPWHLLSEVAFVGDKFSLNILVDGGVERRATKCLVEVIYICPCSGEVNTDRSSRFHYHLSSLFLNFKGRRCSLLILLYFRRNRLPCQPFHELALNFQSTRYFARMKK